MRQTDLLWGEMQALLHHLPPTDQKRVHASFSQALKGVAALESKYTRAIKDRAAVHALLKKTSEDLIQRYQTIFEHSGTAMVVIEDDGIISLANTLFVRLTGCSRQEVENKQDFFTFIEEEYREALQNYHKRRRQGDPTTPQMYESRIIHRSGKILDVAISIGLFPGTRQSIASLTDITDLKAAEASLRLVNKKLNILSNITRHDILNQITVLSTYIELCRMEITDPHLLKYIQSEELAANSIRRQITFTRDYQDIGIQSPVWQDAGKKIRETVRALDLGNVSLTVEVTNVEIFADPLLERVFFNLVENSVRHGEKITQIRFSSTETPEGLFITCEDDGTGVPLAEKENIFNRKYYKHTGFGLYLSREILGMTGITIRETGIQGKGARFEVLVPCGRYRKVMFQLPGKRTERLLS